MLRKNMPLKLLAFGAILAKGLLMTSIAVLVGTTFGQSLILVTVSATMTGLFVLAAAVVTVRLTRPDREALHTIKRAVTNGEPKRESDKNLGERVHRESAYDRQRRDDLG